MAYNNIIEQSIPGFSGLTSSASSIIENLLKGGTSTGPSQNSAAKFGVKTGMPGSGVSNAFGYDLHNKRSDEMKQRGIDDLLKLVTGYSGTVAPTTGQQMDQRQFDQNNLFRQNESNAANSLARQGMLAKEREANKPKWGVVSSGWDAYNGRPSSSSWGIGGGVRNIN